MIKIAISGARGRMGQRICELAEKSKDFLVVALWEREGHADLGKEIAGIKVSQGKEIQGEIDCIIDFSAPESTLRLLTKAKAAKKSIVIGTTGFTKAQQAEIEKAAQEIPILFSPNMSVGVNVLFELVKKAAQVLSDYNINIVEAHHVHKKDAPSGTAKKIAALIEKSGAKVNDIKSIREDEIVGDHKITFESAVDKIELFHSAKTRDIFAQGALKAAKWLKSKPAGLYSMNNVLFENERF